MAEFDAVLVGSGVNALACGALLAREGWRVCVLERNDWLGGAIRTAEITEPGYHHDVFSAWHPLWVGGAAHAQLGDDLAARGLEYLNTELPTATAFPDGGAVVPAAQRRSERSRARAGVARRARALLPERGPGVRRARHRAVGSGRARARDEGVPAARPDRLGRVRRRAAADEPRLARDDVRVGAGARPARAVGAPHRARSRRRVVGIHDAGDRGGRAGGRDADPARRRREARRRARAADPRPRRRVRDRRRRRARDRPLGPRGRRADRGGRRDRRGAGRDRRRDADAALRASGPGGRRPRAGARGRAAASGTAAPRCRSTSPCPSRRAGRATSG